jgi:hypothetical protein
VTPEGHHGVVEVGEVLSEAPAFDSLDPSNISVGQSEQTGLEITGRDCHRPVSSPKTCAIYRTSTS